MSNASRSDNKNPKILFSCEYCRKRKQKCTRESPKCSNCKRYSKECIYLNRVGRIPITKARMRDLQKDVDVLRKALDLSTGNDDSSTLAYIKMANISLNIKSGSKTTGEDDVDKKLKILNDDVASSESLEISQLGWSEKSEELDEFLEQNKNQTKGSIPTDGVLLDGMGVLPLNNGLNFGQVFYGLSSSGQLLRYLQKTEGNLGTSLENSGINYLKRKENIDLLKSGLYETMLEKPQFKEDIIHFYFKVYHPCYPLLNKDYFIKKRSAINDQDSDIAFKILYYTILAIGSYCKFGEKSLIDLLYYRNVKAWISRTNILESGSYELLTALTILGNYLQRRNKPNTSWNYQGLALRMAIGLGLHKEMKLHPKASTKGLGFETFIEDRRRLWWCLFFFDVGLSITFGRPLHIPRLDSINIRYPSNINDNDGLTKTFPTFYSGLIAEGMLAKLSCNILDCLTSTLENECHDMELRLLKLLSCDRSLTQHFVNKIPSYFNENDNISNIALDELCPIDWFDIGTDGSKRIPMWFTFTRKRMIWRYKNLQIVMFRSFIVDTSHDKYQSSTQYNDLVSKATNICSNAARDTINSITEFITNNETNILSAWYACYFLFQASLIPVLFLFRAKDQKSKILWLELVDASKEALIQLESHLSIIPNLIQTLDIIVAPIKEKIIFEQDFNSYSTSNEYSQTSSSSTEKDAMNYIQATTMGLFSNQFDNNINLGISDFNSPELSSLSYSNNPDEDIVSSLLSELFPNDFKS